MQFPDLMPWAFDNSNYKFTAIIGLNPESGAFYAVKFLPEHIFKQAVSAVQPSFGVLAGRAFGGDVWKVFAPCYFHVPVPSGKQISADLLVKNTGATDESHSSADLLNNIANQSVVAHERVYFNRQNPRKGRVGVHMQHKKCKQQRYLYWFRPAIANLVFRNR